MPRHAASPVDEAAAATASGRAPRVVYIMGAGRSGSTALGVALGNCPDAFYAGELDAWLRRRGVPNFGGARREEFWQRVRGRVPDAEELFGKKAWRAFEHSTSVLGHAWRARRRMRGRYLQIARDLYQAIADETGRSWIVDSSHYPMRARELRRIPDLEMHVVLLVRDPRNVVASFAQGDVDQPTKGRLAANAYVWITHLLSLLVYRRWPVARRHMVTYDEFVADPAGVLAAVPPGNAAAESLPDVTRLSTGVAFQGNRVLRRDTISLADNDPDVPIRSALTLAVQLPWLVIFKRLRAGRS